jgi:hypothetical protein
MMFPGPRAKVVTGLVLLPVMVVIGLGRFGLRNVFHKKTIAAAGTTLAAKQTSETAIVLRNAADNALGEPFRRGSLPQPLPAVSGDDDAAQVAKQVSANNDTSAAAFLTALDMSGIGVRGLDGSLLIHPTKSNQGFTIRDAEVAAAMKLYGEGLTLKLQDVSDALTKAAPQLKGAPVADLVLKGIIKSMDSDKPALRFWARFLAELWKQSPKPCDVQHDNCDAADLHVDPLQFMLIMHRLAGDLAAVSSQSTVLPASSRSSYLNKRGVLRNAALIRTSMNANVSEGPANASDAPPIPALPSCIGDETQGNIMDLSALGLNTAFGELLGYLEGLGMSAAGRLGGSVGIANLILTYAQFIATYATLETDITMADAPLVRNKNRQAGQQRTLTAHVHQKIGNWQALNCMRLAMNAVGLDISLPADGAVSGAEIQWHLLEGGSQWNSSTQVLTGPIVEFPNPGKSFQEGGAATDFTVTPVEKGVSNIVLEGAPQRTLLSDKAVPVDKKAVVQFTIALKPTMVKGDAISIGGMVLSGPLAAVIVPLEMLFRSKWYSSKSFTAPVTDWQECGAGWKGEVTKTFTMQKNGSRSIPAKPGVQGMIENETLDRQQTDTWQFAGQPSILPEATQGQWTGILTGKHVNTQQTSFQLGGKCAGKSAKGVTTVEDNADGSGTGQSAVLITQQNATSVHISISPYEDGQTGSTTRSHHVRASGDVLQNDCGHHVESDSVPSISKESFPQTGVEINATIDPQHPNVVKGSKTETAPDGGTTTITWNLTKCS